MAAVFVHFTAFWEEAHPRGRGGEGLCIRTYLDCAGKVSDYAHVYLPDFFDE